MRYKLALALALTIAIVVLLAAPVERGAARTGWSAQMRCTSAGYKLLECLGDPVGAHYYDWTPNPLYNGDGSDNVIIPCDWEYTYQTVHLTVTDLNTGATDSVSRVQWCGDTD